MELQKQTCCISSNKCCKSRKAPNDWRKAVITTLYEGSQQTYRKDTYFWVAGKEGCESSGRAECRVRRVVPASSKASGRGSTPSDQRSADSDPVNYIDYSGSSEDVLVSDFITQKSPKHGSFLNILVTLCFLLEPTIRNHVEHPRIITGNIMRLDYTFWLRDMLELETTLIFSIVVQPS
ncbi:hypothetical protein EVAR_81534_1 [Eumeta japonica]|uniref:Uncharacterized protein n=1 Tax=Eumeta variegata TaxID=151549 RepID=A0A4C1UZW4_EUMVA|nr:hypothetical protein EVAR_81534_1 [Eumeta japonica]